MGNSVPKNTGLKEEQETLSYFGFEGFYQENTEVVLFEPITRPVSILRGASLRVGWSKVHQQALPVGFIADGVRLK